MLRRSVRHADWLGAIPSGPRWFGMVPTTLRPSSPRRFATKTSRSLIVQGNRFCCIASFAPQDCLSHSFANLSVLLRAPVHALQFAAEKNMCDSIAHQPCDLRPAEIDPFGVDLPGLSLR